MFHRKNPEYLWSRYGRVGLTKARQVVKEINRFVYTNYDGIGTINELGMELIYFSEFHKYWHKPYTDKDAGAVA